ncbi:MAG: hypothetical protein HOK06_04865 [Rhodospirillaceae bacterium]|jgi:hypothetical protein|nr:hypothetical protein [Rhodospirillaceae bacterium]MBT6406914.1 hypothetical protein [Rhodospirillaceae bacterium]
MFVRFFRWTAAAIILTLSLPGPGLAGAPSVLDVKVSRNGDGTYGFSTTVFHKDTGWKHYADKWDILGPDGEVIATRVLYHPHVDEQPFTRSLARVAIPVGLREVTVRAHCKVDGDGTRTFRVKLPPRR